MFGLNPYALAAGAAGWALAALMAWAALHEHGVAASQASRDQASYAQAQASVTAAALKQQQAIDAKELAQANTMRAQADQAVAGAQATVKAALDHAAATQQAIRTIIRSEPAAACAKQAPPAPLCGQIPGCMAPGVNP